MGSNTLRIFLLQGLGVLIVCITAVVPALVYYVTERRSKRANLWYVLASLVAAFIAKEASWYYAIFGGLKGNLFYFWLFAQMFCYYFAGVVQRSRGFPWKAKTLREVTLPIPLPPESHHK